MKQRRDNGSRRLMLVSRTREFRVWSPYRHRRHRVWTDGILLLKTNHSHSKAFNVSESSEHNFLELEVAVFVAKSPCYAHSKLVSTTINIIYDSVVPQGLTTRTSSRPAVHHRYIIRMLISID